MHHSFQTYPRGSCQCGGVRYELTGNPIVLYACHCLDCQKQSSSAFGLSLWVERSAFDLQSGELSFWSTVADSGNPKLCAFCPVCGSRIYHTENDQSDILSIKAGSLDNTSHLRPAGHIWLKSAQPWITLNCNQKFCFETEPADFDILVQRWQE